MRIGFGCVSLGSASGPSERECIRLVRSAVDGGVTLFDTADAYGNGASERILGRALAGRFGEIEIATKGGYCFDERSAFRQRVRRLASPAARYLLRRGRSATGPTAGGAAYQAQDFSPAHLRAALEASLRRLGTDHVDVYQLHGPPELEPEMLGVMREFVDAGLVGRIGVGAERLDVARSFVADAPRGSEAARADVLQVPFGPLDPGAAPLLRDARRNGVEVWARGIFGGGVMASWTRTGAATLHADDVARLRALEPIAGELGLDLFELAIGLVRSLDEVAVAVLGMSSERHLARNVQLVERAEVLPPDVVERILAATDPSRHGGNTT